MGGTLCVLAVLAALAALLAGCISEPTQVTVEVGTNLPPGVPLRIRATIRRGAVAVPPDAPHDYEWRRAAPSAAGTPDAGIRLPASFAIVPIMAGPRDDAVTVLLEGVTQHETMRRIVRFRFVPQRALVLRIFLAAQCLGPDDRCTEASPCTVQAYCEEIGQTCGERGECVPLPTVLLRDAGTFEGGCAPYCLHARCGEPDGCGGFCNEAPCDGNGVCVGGVCECASGDARCGATCIPAGDIQCQPGETGTQPCGACGTQRRTCSDGCSWGMWGACEGEGACMPGESRVQDCGACGTQSATCDASCQWGAWSACGGTGCTPGDTQTQSCGNCGTQTRTCVASCTWGAWGTCTGQGACRPGATSAQACGACGMQSRTCTASCAWGAYGSCTGTGCTPGTTRQGSCDTCSHQTCTSSCTWGGCTLDAGAACEHRGGVNFRSCTGRCACGRQYCLSSCVWSTGCISFCNGMNTGACRTSCAGGC